MVVDDDHTFITLWQPLKIVFQYWVELHRTGRKGGVVKRHSISFKLSLYVTLYHLDRLDLETKQVNPHYQVYIQSAAQSSPGKI